MIASTMRRTTFERLAARFPQTMFGQIGLFLGHALRGNKAQALEAVSPTSAEAARWDLQYPWEMATGYALIGERDQAIDWLTNATRRGLINYPFLSQHDPLLKSLRQEKRFTDLMEQVRSQWERFERKTALTLEASLEQRQRLQRLFFPEGVAFSGKAFDRTVERLLRYLRPLDGSNVNLVDQNSASWNQVHEWLSQLDAVRRAA